MSWSQAGEDTQLADVDRPIASPIAIPIGNTMTQTAATQYNPRHRPRALATWLYDIITSTMNNVEPTAIIATRQCLLISRLYYSIIIIRLQKQHCYNALTESVWAKNASLCLSGRSISRVGGNLALTFGRDGLLCSTSNTWGWGLLAHSTSLLCYYNYYNNILALKLVLPLIRWLHGRTAVDQYRRPY